MLDHVPGAKSPNMLLRLWLNLFLKTTLYSQVPFLFGLTAIESLANCVIHWIFRRTGRHLFLNDDDEGKPPLLRRMLEDNGEYYFL